MSNDPIALGNNDTFEVYGRKFLRLIYINIVAEQRKFDKLLWVYDICKTINIFYQQYKTWFVSTFI